MPYNVHMDEFNVENASRFLAAFKDIEPAKRPRDSVKQVVISLAPLIRELMERGYTQRQVLDLLKGEYGLKLGYGTFRNYLNQAAKAGRDADSASREPDRRQPREDDENG